MCAGPSEVWRMAQGSSLMAVSVGLLEVFTAAAWQLLLSVKSAPFAVSLRTHESEYFTASHCEAGSSVDGSPPVTAVGDRIRLQSGEYSGCHQEFLACRL